MYISHDLCLQFVYINVARIRACVYVSVDMLKKRNRGDNVKLNL